METIEYGKILDSWFGSHFDLEWPLLHNGIELVMCLVFQKILLFHINILIPNNHPYVWFKLKFKFGLRVTSVLKCLPYPYTYHFDHRGAFSYI